MGFNSGFKGLRHSQKGEEKRKKAPDYNGWKKGKKPQIIIIMGGKCTELFTALKAHRK